MLCRQNQGRDFNWLAILIAHRKLRFRIWPKLRGRARFACLSQTAQDRMGILDRGGHQIRGFIGGKAKHDPLVACTLVFILCGVHALCDMGGLLVQEVGDLTGFPMEFVLLIPNVADTRAGDIFDTAHVVAQLILVGQTNLAADHNAIGRGESLASNARFGFFGQKRVQDRIRDTIAYFIRVTFRNGFGGENIVLTGHDKCSIGVKAATSGSRCGAKIAPLYLQVRVGSTISTRRLRKNAPKSPKSITP
jgi:hypothetical protein